MVAWNIWQREIGLSFGKANHIQNKKIIIAYPKEDL